MRKSGRFKMPKIKTWQLILILVPLLFIDATLLRMNNVRMVELVEAVVAADEEGDNEKIAQALEDLTKFVFSDVVITIVPENGVDKIIFGTGTFYLTNQYERAAEAALKEAEKNLSSDSNPNGNIYALASSVCQPQAIANGWNWTSPKYIECMTTEINKYPAAEEIQDKIIASLPSTELYRKSYASPLWAPSLTGFMILITLIIIVVIFIRGIIFIVLRLSLLFM